jgi:LPS-assembly protein
MPDDYIQRASINLASDLQYPKDFPLETMNHGDAAMENRVSVTKNTKDQHFSVDTSYYANLLQADPLAGNDDAVHRLPEIRWSQVEKNIGETNFVYTINLECKLFHLRYPDNKYLDIPLLILLLYQQKQVYHPR